MKAKKYITILTIGLLFFSVSSCDLTEVNTDPTRPLDVDLRLILPTAIGQMVFNQVANPARISGIVMQHFRGFDAQQVAYTDYVITSVEFNNYWNFAAYSGVLKDTRDLISKAEAENQPYYLGIARIIRANAYGMLASMFGDVPESRALLGTDDLKPAYDTQEQVYDAVFGYLDQAISDLSQPEVDGGPSDDDLIYGGDADAWIKTAHALKARYMLHISNQRGFGGIESEINAAFSSPAGAPQFQWTTAITASNPLAKFGIQRPNTLIIDFRFGDDMTTRADPRLDMYINTKLKEDGTVDLYEFYNASNSDLVWAQLDSNIPLISYTELMYTLAEVELMGNSDEAAAQTALTAGITASFLQVGVDPTSTEATTYMATYGDLSLASTTAAKHEMIMVEAYYGLYAQAEQTVWTNYRRTGYPNLTPSPNGTNGLNPSGQIPRRWPYPVDEGSTNAEMLAAAVANQGPDLLSTDLWSFK